MPWIYKLGSYWGGLDGSRMFWVWLLSTFAAIAIRQSRDRHRELIPYAIAILMVILDFFVILVIFYDRPFDTLLAEVPMIGKGLNPLLQHRYMPGVPPFVPLLYAGYVSASIPFAFGMAVLISGNLDEPWPQSARRWMQLCCWSLSLGLLLCSMWTYRVVGWGVGGSWDPAQNQLMWPWLTATAFLGSIKIQKRRGTLTVWNVLLLILTFLLSTFRAARSGEMLSIHAFGWDPKLDACFLVFLGVCGTLGFGLLLLRLPATGNR